MLEPIILIWQFQTFPWNLVTWATFCVWVALDLLCCQVPKLGKWRIADPSHGILSLCKKMISCLQFWKSQYMHSIICAKITFSNLLHANQISNPLPNIKLLINTLLSIEYILLLQKIAAFQVRLGRGFNCQN